LVVAGTADAVIMVEGGGMEVSETVLLEAIMFAHEEIKKIVELQNKLQQLTGKTKRTLVPIEDPVKLKKEVREYIADRLIQAIRIPGKHTRQEALNLILEDAVKHFNTAENAGQLFDNAQKDLTRDIANIFDNYERKKVRNMIFGEGLRAIKG